MKKRIMSLLLCMLVAFSAVMATSCGEEEDLSGLNDKKIASASTITLYGIKGEGTTDEAVAMVQDAMSSITEAQFNTALRLMLYTEDEYETVLEEKLDSIKVLVDKEAEEAAARKAAEKEAKKLGIVTTTAAEEVTEEPDETFLDEYGLPATAYPEVGETQLDIFLMTSRDMLLHYVEKKMLSPLDTELNGSSKLLKKYINPTLLSATKINGMTYAIMNNKPMGEYTYLLLNRELIDKYYYDPDEINCVSDALDFMLEVGQNDPDFVPFMGDTEPLNINYFTFDGSKSLIGCMVPSGTPYDKNCKPGLLLDNEDWVNHIKAIKILNDYGYVGSEKVSFDDKFGAAVIKGSYANVSAFADDYYIKEICEPMVDTDDVYGGMFGVSVYTKDLTRSMEILTYLNTKSDLRNIFAYGIEGVHYELDKNGIVKKLNNDYNVKLEYTGNEFILYPPEGTTADVWEAAKAQNIDVVQSPYMGFTYTEDMLDLDLMESVRQISASFYDELAKVPTNQVDKWLQDYWNYAITDDSLRIWASAVNKNEKTIGRVYSNWYKETYK